MEIDLPSRSFRSFLKLQAMVLQCDAFYSGEIIRDPGNEEIDAAGTCNAYAEEQMAKGVVHAITL
jgi:hypothetical protein